MKVSDFLQVLNEYSAEEMFIGTYLNAKIRLTITNIVKFMDKEIKEISFEFGTSKDTNKTVKRIVINVDKECEQE